MDYSTSKERNAFIRSSGPDSFHCIRLFPGNNSESFTANGHVTGRLPAKIMLTIVWLMPNCFDMCFCLIFIMREDYHPIISLSMIFFIHCNIFLRKGFAMIIAKSYISYMEKRRSAFSKALRYFIENGKNITQAKIAKHTGIKQGMISGMKTGKRWGTEESRRAIAAFFNKPYEEFLTVGEQLLETENSLSATHAQSASNITNMADKHKALIDEYQQKELALEINHLLVEIERKNPALLTIIKAQLSGMAAECAPVDIKKRTTGNGKA
jgi:transcriptional regulator with XRE-family HTH domain